VQYCILVKDGKNAIYVFYTWFSVIKAEVNETVQYLHPCQDIQNMCTKHTQKNLRLRERSDKACLTRTAPQRQKLTGKSLWLNS